MAMARTGVLTDVLLALENEWGLTFPIDLKASRILGKCHAAGKLMSTTGPMTWVMEPTFWLIAAED